MLTPRETVGFFFPRPSVLPQGNKTHIFHGVLSVFLYFPTQKRKKFLGVKLIAHKYAAVSRCTI